MKTLVLAAIRCSLLFFVPSVTYAISAQWDLDPISGDWSTAANWTPNRVPNGPSDIATFGLSHTSDVSISANTEVNSIPLSTPMAMRLAPDTVTTFKTNRFDPGTSTGRALRGRFPSRAEAMCCQAVAGPIGRAGSPLARRLRSTEYERWPRWAHWL
jgi:hypothetical protein